MDTHETLTPAALHILLALANGERHGYGIMQEIARLTDGAFTLGPGTLYRSIQRLLAAGLIAETESPVAPDEDDERRRYYELTGAGRAAASAELDRLDKLVRIGRMVSLIRDA